MSGAANEAERAENRVNGNGAESGLNQALKDRLEVVPVIINLIFDLPNQSIDTMC